MHGDTPFTLAIIDGNMPQAGDGEIAAGIVRKNRIGVKIASLSSERLTWGDQNWDKLSSLSELLKAIESI